MNFLRTWLNEDIKLSRPVNSFEEDMANGYLLGELLHQLGLLPNLDGLVDNQQPAGMVANLVAVRKPLIDLGIKFESKDANNIMTQCEGAASNLCYKIKTKVESAGAARGGGSQGSRSRKDANMFASTIKVCHQPAARAQRGRAARSLASPPAPSHPHTAGAVQPASAQEV